MQYAIMGMVFGLCLFIIPMWAYRKGLKDGLNIARDRPIEPIKSPVAVLQDYKQAKADKAKTDEMTEGLANLLNYDGSPQDKGGGK